MADAPRRLNKQQIKLAMIPILAVCLLYVLLRSDDQADSGDPAPTQTADQGAPATDPGVAQATRFEELPRRHWPDRSLPEVLAFDPFSARRPQSDHERQLIAQQQASQENAVDQQIQYLMSEYASKTPDRVIRSRHGTAAVIGAKTLRVGDIVDGVARVVAIRNDGIVFELIE